MGYDRKANTTSTRAPRASSAQAQSSISEAHLHLNNINNILATSSFLPQKLRLPLTKAIPLSLAVLLVLGLSINITVKFFDTPAKDIQAGRDFLLSLEKKDPQKIADEITQAQQTKQSTHIKDVLVQSKNNPSKIWSLFDGWVILGDSRGEAFRGYNYLPTSQVLAQKNKTIADIDNHLDEIKELHPHDILLIYGLNDVESGLWPTSSQYITSFKKKITALKKAAPNAHIYVNSILPATNAASAKVAAYRKIPTYNEALKEMCKELKVGYIDCDPVVSSQYFEPDGEHYAANFYPVWGRQIMAQVLSYITYS